MSTTHDKDLCSVGVSSRQSNGYPSLQQGNCCGGKHQILYFSDSIKEHNFAFSVTFMKERSGSFQTDFLSISLIEPEQYISQIRY